MESGVRQSSVNEGEVRLQPQDLGDQAGFRPRRRRRSETGLAENARRHCGLASCPGSGVSTRGAHDTRVLSLSRVFERAEEPDDRTAKTGGPGASGVEGHVHHCDQTWHGQRLTDVVFPTSATSGSPPAAMESEAGQRAAEPLWQMQETEAQEG